MGVIPCHRGNCENIMCGRQSYKFGNICNECFEELLKRPFCDIEEFMKTNPDKRLTEYADIWEAAVNNEFGHRHWG